MRKRPAFTLIELLFVMAVIGLLVGLLFPSLQRAKAVARRAMCAKNLQNVGVSMRMYLDDSGDIMPVAAGLPSAHLNDWPRIADVLAPYMNGPDSLKCPGDTEKEFFSTEGSSYEYAAFLGGRKVTQSFLTQKWGEWKTPVMYDYEPFHGPAGQLGSANFLFADSHVGDLE